MPRRCPRCLLAEPKAGHYCVPRVRWRLPDLIFEVRPKGPGAVHEPRDTWNDWHRPEPHRRSPR